MRYCSSQHRTSSESTKSSSPVLHFNRDCHDGTEATTPRHTTTDVVSALARPLHSFWSYFSPLNWYHIEKLPTWRVAGSSSSAVISHCFSHCSWGSWSKNTEVVCHSLLQWTTFCQNSSPWPIRLGWPYMARLMVSLSYTRLRSMWSFWLALCKLPDGRNWLWGNTSTSALLTTLKPLTVWISNLWKVHEEMGIPDNLTYLLRNLHAGQEATVRTEHGTKDWVKTGKGVREGLFNLYAEYTMWNAGLDESQAGAKTATSTASDIPEGKRGEWKSWLKTQHSKNQDHSMWSHHFMANRWGKVETVTDFIFLGSKIITDGDCSLEIKTCLLLGRKAKTNLNSISKSINIILPTKWYITISHSQSYGFSNSQ